MKHTISEWKARQAFAADRELNQVLSRIAEIESALGLPSSNLSDIGKARRRLENLRAQAAQHIDPDDDWSDNKNPIYL